MKKCFTIIFSFLAIFLVAHSVVAQDISGTNNTVNLDGSSVNIESVANPCRLSYQGSSDITNIQQELKNQGYIITKIDGKYGPETRAAVSAFQSAVGAQKVDGIIGEETRGLLTKASLCNDRDSSQKPEEVNTSIRETQEVVTIPEVSKKDVIGTNFIQKTEIIETIRSTGFGVRDDTAVFTYRLLFNNDQLIYISTDPEKSFSIDIFDTSGNKVLIENVQSIVSTAPKVRRTDGSSYFRITKGSTLSLRSTVQPGPGSYYAQLGALSYTIENATTVQDPAMINYGLDDSEWKSEEIILQN